MTEASALEMLRSPSAPSPHGEEEEGLGVAEEPPAFSFFVSCETRLPLFLLL